MKDLVVVLTGASSGIGRAAALALAAEGATVIGVARRAGLLEEVAGEAAGVPGRIVPMAADVTEAEQALQVAAAVEARFGPAEVLIYSAGVYHPGPVAEAAMERLGELVSVNLAGAYFWSRAFLPGMIRRGRGHLIFVSSLAGKFPLGTIAPYCGTKSGLIAFANGLRMEVRPLGIAVTTVCPRVVETPLVAGHRDDLVAHLTRDFGVSRPEATARQLVWAVRHRPREVVDAGWAKPAMALASAWPGLVDWFYAYKRSAWARRSASRSRPGEDGA